MTKDTLLLIDGHALVHRAFHALPENIKTKDGVQVNAVFGFTRILLEVLEKVEPKYIICAFDSRGATQRHDMFVDYKGTRQVPDDALLNQIPIIFNVLEAFNIPTFAIPGFEADDIIGTIIRSKEASGLDKVVLTGDHDILQLVDEDVKVFMTGFNFKDSKVYGIDEVKERYKFGPEHIVDYKGLKGDTSDNIPGVKGIGQVTATNLINEFGTLEAIYENLDKIASATTKKKLEEGAELAMMSKKLATIITDVPLSFKLNDCLVNDYDAEKVREVFMELEFRSLMNKIPEPENAKQAEPQAEETNYTCITTQEELDEFTKKLKKQKIFAFDSESTGLDQLNSKIIGISFSWKEKEGYYIDLRSDKITDLSQIKEVFEDPKVKKIAHNMKADAHFLRNEAANGLHPDIKLTGYFFDTLLAAYVLSGVRANLSLKNLAFSQCGMMMQDLSDLWAGVAQKEKKNYSAEEIAEMMLKIDIEDLHCYACADADAAWRLYQAQKDLIGEMGLTKLFEEIEMPLVEVLLEMEREGVCLDVEFLTEFGQRIDKRINEIEDEIYKTVGYQFNISSPKQVGEVLFDELGLEGGKKTKTGAWQTNERVLLNLQGTHEIIDLIFEHRELSKLRSTYVQALIDQVDKNTGKVHTNFNQAVASTGRLSSTNPNLQNIPIVTEMGQEIRKAFIAGEGRQMIAFDVSQQELRLLAHFSGEQNLIDAFNNEIDVHTTTASRIFNVPLEKVTKEQRAKGKTLNFSLIYGISAFGLSDRMKISREEAQVLIDSYFKVYPKVKEFFDELIEESKKSGKVTTMFGRYRDASGLLSRNFQIRSATEREVINFPIQGSAADIMKLAMIEVHNYIKKGEALKELDPKMILQVHDELIFTVNEGFDEKGKQFQQEIIKLMEESVKLSVPMKVEVQVGRNWGEI